MKKKCSGMSKALFIFLLSLLPTILGYNYTVVVDQLPVGKSQVYSLNITTEYIIEILNLPHNIQKFPPRISLKCNECNKEYPLLVVVRQSKGVLSWELPIVTSSNRYNSVYKTTERTLCPYSILNTTVEETLLIESKKEVDQNVSFPVTLSLSTSSLAHVSVELVVNLQDDFVINLNETKSVNVTPSSPYFFLYEFPSDDASSILLHVTSKDDTCMIVSIQNVSCPIFDLEQNIQYKGHFQTITRQGGLTLTRESFPYGFYIVLIVSGDNNYCYSVFLDDQFERMKNVNVFLSKTISPSDYYIAILFTLSILFIFCTTMLIIDYFYYKREKNSVPVLEFLVNENGQKEESIGTEKEEKPTASHHISNFSSPLSFENRTVGGDTLSVNTDSSLDETDFDLVCDAEFDKDIFRMKGYLYVCDLARKNHSVLKKKSELYFWNLLTVAIFYFLPVIQLVVTNQYQLNQTGKEDLCYYNFLCSHPLWFFSDFNHVFSNIGYLFLGSLFMVSTMMKEKLHKIKICSDKNLYRNYGIPQHFGLFYAMGAALIVEGILSACYHICPNHYNFQFDSSFMYVISTLCMIKIYQTRHPDINAAAYTTFFLLAGVIFIGMCGVFSNNLTFRILFSILHLCTCAYISLKIYYIGRWKLNLDIFIRFCRELKLCRHCNLKYFLPSFSSRFVLLMVANLCNWGLAVGSFWYNIHNFSSYLLTIFMVNLMLYTLFYIIMKFVCKERIQLRSAFYIVLSIFAWSAALYFFFSKTTSWRLTPAESKLYNQPCELLNFYDNHDIWHFISAAAMFFSFMVLLTLDDDLTYIHRSKILVF